jgi:glycine oxidase
MKSVVIVGGGVIGLFAAVRLAKAGARVTLLEAEGEHHNVYGPGASAAAAGMLAPLNEDASPHDGVALESFDLWRRLRDGAEWADGVRFDGGVVLWPSAVNASRFAIYCRTLERSAAPLNAGQFRKYTGFEAKVDNAVFVEDEGVADPLRVLSGLSMQARAHGVIVENNCDVENVTANAAKTHEGRLYEADLVVLAPGAWATQKLKAAAPALRRVRPGKGHLVSVALAHQLAPNLRAPGFYIAQRREDVVLGATLELDRTDRRRDPARVAELMAQAEMLLPGEVGRRDAAWAGIRPMSPDGWPMIGRSGEVLIAAGHSRNGWLLAPITAEIITAYVMGGEIPPAWAALSPDRFGSP